MPHAAELLALPSIGGSQHAVASCDSLAAESALRISPTALQGTGYDVMRGSVIASMQNRPGSAAAKWRSMQERGGPQRSSSSGGGGVAARQQPAKPGAAAAAAAAARAAVSPSRLPAYRPSAGGQLRGGGRAAAGQLAAQGGLDDILQHVNGLIAEFDSLFAR
jgi:hypothetical protein